MSRTRINEDDAPDLQSDAEAAVHAADTTSVHGIADTSTLSTTAHDHDADYEAAGGIATHSADSTSVHGITDTSALVVDGDAAGGELAGTYPNPTVAAAHSGSTHAATQAAAEATAAGALSGHEADTSVHGIADTTVLATDAEVATAVSDHAAAANPHPTYETAAEVLAQIGTHEGLADPHPGYLTPAEGNAAYEATGAVAGHEADTTNVHAHTSLSAVGIDDHHPRDHAINAAVHTGTLDDAQIPATITRDAEAAAAYAAIGHSHSGATTTYAPGSFTVATGNYALMVKRLQLTTTQRATLAGTARLRIT